MFASEAPPRRRRRRFPPRVPLRTLVLLVAAAAAWTSFLVESERIDMFDRRIGALRPLDRRLLVDDPARVVVANHGQFYEGVDDDWDIHLPPGSFRLCLATRGVGRAGLAPAVAGAPIGPGRHRVSCQIDPIGNGRRIRVRIDGATALSTEAPWDETTSFQHFGHFDLSIARAKSWPPDVPAVFHRIGLARRDADGQLRLADGPGEGILLWIEPDPAR
jgi:hypothetical protein